MLGDVHNVVSAGNLSVLVDVILMAVGRYGLLLHQTCLRRGATCALRAGQS